jgi:hypothetical protein
MKQALIAKCTKATEAAPFVHNVAVVCMMAIMATPYPIPIV